MAKHCIFEHFLSFGNQNRAKPWVIVTLHKKRGIIRCGRRAQVVLKCWNLKEQRDFL